ncbi:MAG: reductive dehalogenase [Candidatus Thorarchaeota archaeon]
MEIIMDRCMPDKCQKECIEACASIHDDDAPLQFNSHQSTPSINENTCTRCLSCVRACPFDAIVIEQEEQKDDREGKSQTKHPIRTLMKPYELSKEFKQFSEADHIFARVHNDPDFKHYQHGIYSRADANIAKGIPGYTRLEHELSQASWKLYSNRKLLSQNIQDSDLEVVGDRGQVVGEKRGLTKFIKRVAKFYGSALVGIAPIDRRWLYTSNRQREPYDIPESINRAIVVAVEMDYDDISTSPAYLSSSASVLGYSKMAFIEIEMTAFIERLGYKAIPCGNDVALSVPLAIDAGLGGYGRHGILITKEYGPRVRIAKIFTDMPLLIDQPDIDFCESIVRFCEVCEKCAEHCPSQSIPYGRRQTWKGMSEKSNNPGVRKWYINPETCFGFWVENGGDCSNCISSCPYNKPNDFFNRILHLTTVWFTQHMPMLNRLIVKLDDLFGFGKQKRSSEIWSKHA